MAANAVLPASKSQAGVKRDSSDLVARIVFAAVAVVLVLYAFKAPIWQARLSAPQYPQGLKLTASAAGVVGDISEINELNHYVGMSAFNNADAPEMKLWNPVMVLALIAIGIGTFLPKGTEGWTRWIGKFARLGLWLIPIGALADVQFRLYQYGHSVKPDAPIRLDPFMPLVVGPTHVLNFTTWAYPGQALWALFGGAFLVTFGPGIVRRIRTRMHGDDLPPGAETVEAS